jgi:ParB family chromosome partitioning protein
VRSVEEIVAVGGAGDDEQRRTGRGGRTGGADPALLDAVAGRLEDRLETRAQIKANAKGRGRITLEFASLDDLRRLVDLIDPS